jgi:hypothetical protein
MGFTFPMMSSQSDFRHSLHLSSVIMSIFPEMWSKISSMYFFHYGLRIPSGMFFLSPWIHSSSCVDMVFTFPHTCPVLLQIWSSSFSIWCSPILTVCLHLSLDKEFIFTQIFSSLLQRYCLHLSFDIIFIFPQLQCLHVLRYDLLPRIWCSQFL